ncbi:uncharacterized protein LOC111023424 [Momordica charantia]|uniref:Uncharacterized protein LOC111023424 n=1 Tax=Momordica charantia TaxID=3673 RepID=A0A6J1DVA0_MOMCH|nr:uncharacterized protein LOC111023424 [Momordica charantia]
MPPRRSMRLRADVDPAPVGENVADPPPPPIGDQAGVVPPFPPAAAQELALINNTAGVGGAQTQPPRHLHTPQSEAQFIKDFKRYGPPTFGGGSERATLAEEWVRELEALYAYLGCEDQFKVKGAVFMLRSEALNWWDSVAATEDHANVPVPWARFKNLLYDHYYRETVEDMKEVEFLHLVQGTLTVAQYERKFTELSSFALELIPTEAMKIKRFVKGLHKGIRGSVDLQRPVTYAEAVRGTLIMDKDVSNRVQPLVEVGSSLGVKRKVPPTYADQPFRAPQRPAQQ